MRLVVGIDIGATEARVVAARLARQAFEIHRLATIPLDELDERLAELRLSGARAVVGVTGREMILRTTIAPGLPDAQLEGLVRLEVDEIAEQSGGALSADWGRLAAGGEQGDLMLLLALVKESLVEERSAMLAEAGLKVAAFTPNAIALHNACIAADGGEGTVMVAALGGRDTDVAIVQDGDLLFARNLAGGADLFGAAGRVTDGPLRQLSGMLQSTATLCRTQLQLDELKLDRVLLTGPGGRLPGLDQALTRSLGLGVTLFDPTAGYVVGDADPGEDGSAYAVATGLAMMALLPQSYRIEILSAGARRARDFRERTLWLLGAGVLAAGLLALDLVTTRADTLDAEADLARLRREVQTRQAAVRDVERATTEAAELAARLAVIESAVAPGAGSLLALDLLSSLLPEELWLTSVRSVRAVEPQFGHGTERRPAVVVAGRGKEVARALPEAVTELTTELRGHPRVAHVLPQMNPDPRGDFVFELRLDASVVDQAGEAP